MKRYLSKFELTFEFVRECIYDCLNGTTTRCSRWKRRDTALFIAEYVIEYKKIHGYNDIPTLYEASKIVHKLAIEERESCTLQLTILLMKCS